MLNNDDPLEEAAPQAMKPRHLTKEMREYETTTYSRLTVNALEWYEGLSKPSCDHSDRRRLKLTKNALVDQLLEEVSDAPEPVDRVAGATRAVAAAPAL